MDWNDIFLKSILLLLVGSIVFFVALFYSRSYKEETHNNILSETEKQILKEYFNDPELKDNLDKAYLDNITEIYNKNINILISEITRLNNLLNDKCQKE
jgi:hypothetical protein